MNYLEEYDETDPISIETYAKRLIGKTFADVCKQDDITKAMVVREATNYEVKHENKKRKGGLGELIEERFFHYQTNNDARPDFDKAGVDIIIIGRGGGSIEDLWAFNEMPVADAIYEADTPIISGTGHEVDMTIADYCADVRAATPSAACELAIPDMQSIFTKLSNYREALDMQAEQRCVQLRQQMILLQRQLEAGRPDRKLLKHKLLYERLENRLSQAIKEKYRSRQQMFSRYVDQLSGLAPTNRLKGGYAFAQTKEGRPVASIEQLEKEVPFFLTFSDGEAEVIPVHLKKNKK